METFFIRSKKHLASPWSKRQFCLMVKAENKKEALDKAFEFFNNCDDLSMSDLKVIKKPVAIDKSI